MRLVRTLMIVAGLALLGSCAGAYSKSYAQLSGMQTEQVIARHVAPTIVHGSGNPDRDVEAMWQHGFALVGYSSFDGSFRPDDALKQARKVGAERIIQYARADAAQGVAETTAGAVDYLPTTTYPIERHDQTVFYFAPMGPSCFGALIANGTDAQKRAVGTNSVAVVRAIKEGSPAFNANLLPGDLVLSVGGYVLSLDAPPWFGKSGQTLRMSVARSTPGQAGYRSLELPVTLGRCGP
jgi:hypothetical protein